MLKVENMLNRIGWGFIGFMCLLDCISMLANKSVKVGEKFFKFDDAGYLYLLPALGFLLLSIYGFWKAFRKEPPVVQRLVGMWCPDYNKFYHIGETTCEECGQELLKCYNTHYEKRLKPKTEPLFRSKLRNIKIKFIKIFFCFYYWSSI